MKRAGALVLIAVGAGLAAEYQVQPVDQAWMRLEVRKTGLLRGKQHVFEVGGYSGSAMFEGGTATGTIRLTIPAAEIRCVDQWLSAKDLVKVQQYAQKDMLAADQHRFVQFQADQVSVRAGGTFETTGQLTIRGVTKSVAVTGGLQPDGNNGWWSEGRAGFRMTDFRLKPPTAAWGAVGTEDQMMLRFRIRLERK